METGTRLCRELLEPLRARFGHVTVRSAYRSRVVNRFGNENGLNCASNEANHANHIWDVRDAEGNAGACATVVVPFVADRVDQDKGRDWTALAWWIHDHLPYHSQVFFTQAGAVNLCWREKPERWIRSYAAPRGYLTKAGMDNHAGPHADAYGWLEEALDEVA